MFSFFWQRHKDEYKAVSIWLVAADEQDGRFLGWDWKIFFGALVFS